MARISIASAKAKGRWLQQWAAKKISELTGIPWGKDKLIESRPMGQSGVDVVLRGEAAQLFPYSIECKSGPSSSWTAAVRQAKTNQKEGTEWMVILKHPDFKVPVVMVDGEHFFDLLQGMEKYMLIDFQESGTDDQNS